MVKHSKTASSLIRIERKNSESAIFFGKNSDYIFKFVYLWGFERMEWNNWSDEVSIVPISRFLSLVFFRR